MGEARRLTIRARSTAVLAACVPLAACISLPPDPTDPQIPECMERAEFGPPDESPYVLPYPAGTAYEVFQTYCGPVSHGEDGQMSIDFLMPLGSPVVAARAGVVRRAIDGHEDFGRGLNIVYVEHDDGTSAVYAHLEQGSIRVRPGDEVEAGQVIAASGASGTGLEHLHFGVASTWPVWRPDDVPVNFRNARGELDERGGPKRGAIYLALPTAASTAK